MNNYSMNTEAIRQFQDRVKERYEQMHRKLDTGLTAEEVMREELAAAFPQCSETELDHITADLNDSSLEFINALHQEVPQQGHVEMWQEKLEAMDESDRLSSIHAYRLLHEMMTEENIRLVYEGKLELDEEQIQDRLDSFDTGESAEKQEEDFLNWIGQNSFTGEIFWKQQENMLERMKNMPAEEVVLQEFYQKIGSVEERAIYTCAYIAEMADPMLDPSTIAPMAALFAGASLECEAVYQELLEEDIDQEEALTRLEKIWYWLEDKLAELLPVVAGAAAYAVLVTAYLYLGAWMALPGWVSGLVFAAASVLFVGTMVAVQPVCEKMLEAIGRKITRWSRQRAAVKEKTVKTVVHQETVTV